MANPQTENGFTSISNELLEILYKTNLAGSGHALILAIMRKTYGFHKKEDKISISQLEEMLGLSRRAVIYNIQDLEAKNIIIVKRQKNGERSSEVNIIRLNKDYDTWVVQNSAPGVEKNRASAKLRKKVVQNSVKDLPSFAPTKETLTKESTKEIAEASSAGVVTLIDLFKDVNPTYKKWFANKTQRAAASRLIERYGLDLLSKVVAFLPQSNRTPYMPTITTPLQLEDGWVKLESAWVKKKQDFQVKNNRLIK